MGAERGRRQGPTWVNPCLLLAGQAQHKTTWQPILADAHAPLQAGLFIYPYVNPFRVNEVSAQSLPTWRPQSVDAPMRRSCEQILPPY